MKKEKLRENIILVFLICVFVVSAVQVARKLAALNDNSKSVDEAARLVGIPDIGTMLADASASEVEEPSEPAVQAPALSPKFEHSADYYEPDKEDTSIEVPVDNLEPLPEAPKPKPKTKADIEAEKLKNFNLEALSSIDIAALQEINSEVLGWIIIPGTQISYPLLQHEDNSYYLDYTWDKKKSYVGAIYLDCRSSSSFTDFNTIIYGHNLKSTAMFSGLKKYAKQSYLDAHPDIYIALGGRALHYRIAAAIEVPVTSAVYTNPQNEEARQNILDETLLASASAGLDLSTSSNYITLSTCTASGHEHRWVILAVLD